MSLISLCNSPSYSRLATPLLLTLPCALPSSSVSFIFLFDLYYFPCLLFPEIRIDLSCLPFSPFFCHLFLSDFIFYSLPAATLAVSLTVSPSSRIYFLRRTSALPTVSLMPTYISPRQAPPLIFTLPTFYHNL